MAPSSSVAALHALAGPDGPQRQLGWRVLAERHGPDVWRLIASRLRQAHEAEDAYQEFWLRLPALAASFAPATADAERKAHAWLLRIAYTAATDRLRRRRPVRELVDDLPAQEDAMSAASDDERRALLARINRAIEELPESYRRPVLLHIVGGLSYEDLAADLRCTVNNARVKVHRGLQRLRAQLASDGSELSGSALAAVLVPPLALPALPALPAPGAVAAAAAPAAAAPAAAGPLAVLTQVPVLIGAGTVATATAITATVVLSGDPMPTVPAATALLAASVLSAAVVDDFERDAIAMVANGQGGAACTVELVAAPAGGTGKALRLAWPAPHGMWADASYTEKKWLELTAEQPQTATLRVWCEAFGGVKQVSIRFQDSKGEFFQWQTALPDAGTTGWRSLSIPIDWAKPQTIWGGNADKRIDWPVRCHGIAIEMTKEAPAGSIIVDDVRLAAPEAK